MTTNNMKQNRRFEGIVVSDKMMKTVVVAVESVKTHPKYQKSYRVTKRFKAHSENNEFKTGDKVVIEETNPISRDKRWKVVSKI